MLRGLRLAERRGPLRHVFETVGVFPRVGLDRLCGRSSLGLVGVSLCRGVVHGAAPAFGRVPQGGGLGYGGGDVCLYRTDGLAGFLAHGVVGAGLRLLRRGFHVGARGYAVEKNVLLWALAVWHLWVVRTESWHGLKGWRTASCCAVFSLAVPLYSAVWLPPVDFLPFGRGAALSAVPGFGVYDGRYEEVTDSLMEVSGSKPLVAVVSRRELTVDDLRKLSGLRAEAGAGRISLCLWMLPGLNGGAGMDVFYTDEVTLKSLLRAEVGFVVVDGGIVRAKRNLSVFRPARFGRNVTVGEMMEEDAGLPWHYGVCVLAGLAVMVWVRRKETEGGR